MTQLLKNIVGDLLPRVYAKGERHPADKVQLANGKIENTEWANLLDIRATIDFRVFNEESVGAVFNWRNSSGRPTLVFGWEIEGNNVYELEFQIQSFYDNWIKGLNGMPFYQSWKIHLGTEYDSVDRSQDLSRVIRNIKNPGVMQIQIDELSRTQELTRAKLRGNPFVRLYVYYWGSRDKSQGDADDVIEAGIKESLKFFEDLKSMVSGRKAKTEAEDFEQLLKTAYYSGFTSAQNLLMGTFGMKATPMTESQLWANLRKRFSGDEPLVSPYKIICSMDKSGVKLTEIRQAMHIGNALPVDFPPILSDEGVFIKRWDSETESVKPDYIGVLQMREKVPGWSHEYHQLKWIWDLFENESFKNLEVFIDISPGSRKAQRENAKDAYRQAAKRQVEAVKAGEYNEYASRTLQEGKEILDQFSDGSLPFRAALVVLVHSESPEGLDRECREVQSRFRLCRLEREWTCAPRVWLQTLPCFEEHLLQLKIKILNMGYPMPGIDINFRHYYSTKQAIGFLPFVRTLKNDSFGVEFIATDRQPILVDIFTHGNEKHWSVIAKHRRGKSSVGIDFSFMALAVDQPVTVIDSPPQDGSSSLHDICDFCDGAHVDVISESINLLGIPKALLSKGSALTPQQRADRFKILQQFWIELLMVLGGPTEEEKHLTQVTKEILELALHIYLNDNGIQTRYSAAIRDGFGSVAWTKTPTLTDFVEFTRPHKIQHHLAKISGPVEEALDFLELRLSKKADPTTAIGAAIARPSTVDVENCLYTVYSLRGMRAGSEESLAYILAAHTFALQKSLVYDISHIILEEFQSIASFPGVLRILSDIATRGGKAGIRLGVISNSFERLNETENGKDFLNNLTTKFIGPIEPRSIEPLSECLKIPIELMRVCSRPNFGVQRSLGYTSWLIEDGGKRTIVRRYSSWLSSAISGSQINERKARAAFKQLLENKYVAMAAYAEWFRSCAEANRPVLTPSDNEILKLGERWQKVFGAPDPSVVQELEPLNGDKRLLSNRRAS
jgi:hypothetical protein